jgi:hypothetical protein
MSAHILFVQLTQKTCDYVYKNDNQNLVLLATELYPELRTRGKIFVLHIANYIAMLPDGTHLTSIYSSAFCYDLFASFSGIDFIHLVNYVDYFYARTFGYGGLGSDEVQFHTAMFPYFVRIIFLKRLIKFEKNLIIKS